MSVFEINENENLYTLPPIICNNLHEKISPEKIPIKDIVPKSKVHINAYGLKHEVPAPTSKLQRDLYKTIRPIAITWAPDKLYFKIDQDVVVKKIWVWNCCDHIIYLHSCGFWNERARLGASWCCHPRTRFKLAPGIVAEMFIQATPRERSPVPFVTANLQIAAAYNHDIVIGHFKIPIEADFKNCLVHNEAEDG